MSADAARATNGHRSDSGSPLSDRSGAVDICARGVGKKFGIYVNDRDRVFELFSRKPRHQDFWALRDVSFQVPRGSAFGIIGSNGAGKSTLLRLIAGVSQPSEGRLEVNASISSLLDLGLGFHTDFSGRENIYLNCTVLGMSRKEIDELVPSIVAFAELESFIDYPVKTYSAGMGLRLGFAIAAHLTHQIFLIDEVLTVGDQYFQRKCVRKIEEFIDQGRTIVLVSHDLHSVRSLCDQVLWLREGRVVALGPAAEVVDAYVDAIRAREAQVPVPQGGVGRVPPRPPPAEAFPAPADSAPSGEGAGRAAEAGGEEGEASDSAESGETTPPAPSTPSAVFGSLEPPPPGSGDPSYLATTDDPGLKQRLVSAMRLDDLSLYWGEPDQVEPFMEYHGDMPLITGSGEVKIYEVKILGADGTPATEFVTGDPVTVAVLAKVIEPVEDPIFGVAIHRNDDVYVYGPNTGFDGCMKGTYHGLYTFFLHYPSLPLLAGTYQLSVAVFDKHHLKPYVWHNRLYPITFKADREDHGLVVIPHHWGVVTHVSGPREAIRHPFCPRGEPRS